MSTRANAAHRRAHPALVTGPAIALGTTVFLDAMYLNEPNPLSAYSAYVTLVGGLLAMTVALPFVLLDCRHFNARARVIARLYALTALLGILCFSVAWLLRGSADPAAPPDAAIIFSFLGGAHLIASAWLRDELLNAAHRQR